LPAIATVPIGGYLLITLDPSRSEVTLRRLALTFMLVKGVISLALQAPG
jgi:hypothetical protein